MKPSKSIFITTINKTLVSLLSIIIAVFSKLFLLVLIVEKFIAPLREVQRILEYSYKF